MPSMLRRRVSVGAALAALLALVSTACAGPAGDTGQVSPAGKTVLRYEGTASAVTFPELAEDLGYDHGWVPDSQMIWSDCYAVLALAAANTSRIRLGTGVAIAGTRIAPVTAHSIATINQIAPGRVFLGIGTGHTAMRVMGFDPVKPKAFADYLRVVRGLLHGEEVSYRLNGETRDITFLHRDMGFFDLEHPVPIYVAANGPLALEAAGAYGDGRISAGGEPPVSAAEGRDVVGWYDEILAQSGITPAPAALAG